jgi:thiaminase/transcriptional activator TenA
MSTAVLLERHAARWTAAVRHPFLDGVRDGSVPVAAFDTWLTQDFRFVSDLLAFQSRLAARAPASGRSVLADGVEALEDELLWFRRLARERGLDLAAAPLSATLAYADLLSRLDAAPYAVAVTALWALERVYLEAWRYAAPGAPAYRELVEHWTTPGFAVYVAMLSDLVEDAAPGAEVDGVLVEVLEQEHAFWDMAMSS